MRLLTSVGHVITFLSDDMCFHADVHSKTIETNILAVAKNSDSLTFAKEGRKTEKQRNLELDFETKEELVNDAIP